MNKYVIPSVAFLLGGGVGAGLTYILVKKKFEVESQKTIEDIRKTYAEMRNEFLKRLEHNETPTNEELEEAIVETHGEDFRLREPEGVVVTPDIQEYSDRLEREGYTHYSQPEKTVVNVNIFEKDGPQAMAEAAEHNVSDEEPIGDGEPNKDAPYIITHEEFHDGDPVPYKDGEQFHDKFTLTYFSGDDTLCDDQEVPVPDVEYLIGHDALMSFGKKSGDTNIVYVRNHQTTSDYEILLDKGSYVQKVHGIDLDEDEPRIRKFRDSD